eukprot:1161342-Pelagomonas_calceolata.AAC.1
MDSSPEAMQGLKEFTQVGGGRVGSDGSGLWWQRIAGKDVEAFFDHFSSREMSSSLGKNAVIHFRSLFGCSFVLNVTTHAASLVKHAPRLHGESRLPAGDSVSANLRLSRKKV